MLRGLTAICILLGLFHRPLRFFCDRLSFTPDGLHAFFAPFYHFLWLFHAERFWPFSGEYHDAINRDITGSYFLIHLLGGTTSIVTSLVLVYLLLCALYLLFPGGVPSPLTEPTIPDPPSPPDED